MLSEENISLVDNLFLLFEENIRDDEYNGEKTYQTRDVNGNLNFFNNFNDTMKYVEFIENKMENKMENKIIKISFPDKKSKSRIRLLRCHDNTWYNEPFTCGLIKEAMHRENKSYDDLTDDQKRKYNKLFNNDMIRHWTIEELHNFFG